MMTAWTTLPEPLQLQLAQQAMQHATETIAGHAETLAGEIETGGLSDRGGPDALRLVAALVRAITGGPVPCGRA